MERWRYRAGCEQSRVCRAGGCAHKAVHYSQAPISVDDAETLVVADHPRETVTSVRYALECLYCLSRRTWCSAAAVHN